MLSFCPASTFVWPVSLRFLSLRPALAFELVLSSAGFDSPQLGLRCFPRRLRLTFANTDTLTDNC